MVQAEAVSFPSSGSPVGRAARPHVGQDKRAGLVPIFMGTSWTEFDKRRQSSTHRCLVPGGPHPDLKQASFIPSARGLCPCYSLPLL